MFVGITSVVTGSETTRNIKSFKHPQRAQKYLNFKPLQNSFISAVFCRKFEEYENVSANPTNLLHYYILRLCKQHFMIYRSHPHL